MTYKIAIESATLWDQKNVKASMNIPGVYDFHVCCDGGGWPTFQMEKIVSMVHPF